MTVNEQPQNPSNRFHLNCEPRQATLLSNVDSPVAHRYTQNMLEGTKRKLAAIVSADVAGYSRLMGH